MAAIPIPAEITPVRPDPILQLFLGLGVLLCGLGMAWLFAYPPAWLDPRHAAIAMFSNIGTLAEGADIRENGSVIGNVVSITTEGDHYLVHMKVRQAGIAPDRALAIDEVNPILAASIVSRRVCHAASASGCCPEKPVLAAASAGEVAFRSCGRLPSLIDVAMETTSKASLVLTEFRTTLGLEQASAAIAALPGRPVDKPGLVAKTEATMTAVAASMGSMKAVADRGSALLEQNQQNIADAIANLNSSASALKNFTENNQAGLENAITEMGGVIRTTARGLPGILDNLQATSENLESLSTQIRNEPTSLLRQRERADPDFVDPAPDRH